MHCMFTPYIHVYTVPDPIKPALRLRVARVTVQDDVRTYQAVQELLVREVERTDYDDSRSRERRLF